jgi:putative addiction module CopG family antidote
MRNIINISLPEKMAERVEKEVKKGKFASTSEYIRHLLRMHEFEEEMDKRRKDFEAGKFTRLRSLKDLR